MTSHVLRSTVDADAAIKRAYAHCREITRRHARNFHYGIRLSPEPQRSAIYAVYTWMRLADDLVDSCNAADISTLERRIAEFRANTDAALGGRPSHADPLWLAIADTARRFRLPGEHFHDMLDGQMDDARRTSYETFDQLREYCRRVASTVGLICIEIWGYADPHAAELAAERGIAFQLTNILRDVAQDFDIGRMYLPREDFDRLGLAPDDLRRWTKPRACAELIDLNIKRAMMGYERSQSLDGLIGACGRPTLWAMTSIYRRLLAKIAADPSRIVNGQRVRVSALHKGAIALRAKWLARFVSQGGAVASRHAKAPV